MWIPPACSKSDKSGLNNINKFERMKVHSTNYFNTFIEVAEDTKAVCGIIPPVKDNKTVAEMQYELIANNPYKYTSDDVFFQVFADRNDLIKSEYEKSRSVFFSKGQPCFRASPLTKTYGLVSLVTVKGKWRCSDWKRTYTRSL